MKVGVLQFFSWPERRVPLETVYARALERIEIGTYGTCASCQRPIAEARLSALPYANRCIDCKRLEERG